MLGFLAREEFRDSENLNFRRVPKFGFIRASLYGFGVHWAGRLGKRDEHADFCFLTSTTCARSRTIATFTLSPPFTDTIAFSVVLPSGLK